MKRGDRFRLASFFVAGHSRPGPCSYLQKKKKKKKKEDDSE